MEYYFLFWELLFKDRKNIKRDDAAPGGLFLYLYVPVTAAVVAVATLQVYFVFLVRHLAGGCLR